MMFSKDLNQPCHLPSLTSLCAKWLSKDLAFSIVKVKIDQNDLAPEVIKLFMLNSAEREI